MSAIYNYFLPFVFFLLSFISLVINDFDDPNITFPSFLSLAFIITYVIGHLHSSKKRRNFITPEFIFFIFFSLFHFSYVILYELGLAEYDREVFFSPNLLSKAILYSIMCLAIFLIGYRLDKRNNNFINTSKGSSKKYKLIFSLSQVLVIVAIFLFWLPLLSLGSAVFVDYKLLINIGTASSFGKLFFLSQYVGYAGISLYLITKKKLGISFFKGISSYFIIFYILGFLFIGDRGGFISYLFIYLLAFNFFYKKLLPVTVLSFSIILLLVSSVLAVSRTHSLLHPIDAYIEYSDEAGSPIVYSLVEFGTSIKTVNIAMTYVPEQFPYRMGSSLVDSLWVALPNLFGKRTSDGSLGAWVTEIAFGSLDSTHGRGGSIVMESYMNFGLFGVLLFFIIGFFMKILYSKFLLNNSLIWSVAFFTYIAALSMWMRNTSTLTFRIVIWSVLITFCLMLVTHILRKKIR